MAQRPLSGAVRLELEVYWTNLLNHPVRISDDGSHLIDVRLEREYKKHAGNNATNSTGPYPV